MTRKSPPELPLPEGASVTLVADDLAVIEIPLREPSIPKELSGAETQVAQLVFDGLSNSEIAARRGVSVKTVGNQLERVYRKLNVSSRIELILLLKRTR